MKTIQINLYALVELGDEARQEALREYRYFNVDEDWWFSAYEDAKAVGLKITGFDIDRGAYCKGEFVTHAIDCANLIVDNHGEKNPTYQSARTFIDEKNQTTTSWPKDANGQFEDGNDLEQAIAQIEGVFLSAILNNYRLLLEQQYDYLTSEKAVIEAIEANEYLFTSDGKKAGKLERLAIKS